MQSTEFKRIRKDAGMSQETLASHINKSKRTIQSYEAGTFNIPADVIKKMIELDFNNETLYQKKKKVSASIFMDVSKLNRISLKDALEFCLANKDVFLEEPEIKFLMEKERDAGKIEVMEKHIILRNEKNKIK